VFISKLTATVTVWEKGILWSRWLDFKLGEVEVILIRCKIAS